MSAEKQVSKDRGKNQFAMNAVRAQPCKICVRVSYLLLTDKRNTNKDRTLRLFKMIFILIVCALKLNVQVASAPENELRKSSREPRT